MEYRDIESYYINKKSHQKQVKFFYEESLPLNEQHKDQIKLEDSNIFENLPFHESNILGDITPLIAFLKKRNPIIETFVSFIDKVFYIPHTDGIYELAVNKINCSYGFIYFFINIKKATLLYVDNGLFQGVFMTAKFIQLVVSYLEANEIIHRVVSNIDKRQVPLKLGINPNQFLFIEGIELKR